MKILHYETTLLVVNFANAQFNKISYFTTVLKSKN